MKEKINMLAIKYADLIVKYRREFHRYPELGSEEIKTASKITDILHKLNINTITGIAGTGVIGVLRGRKPGKVFALRADMDALPICEKTGQPFASIKEGVMHACGHDMHIAILLGCAHILADLRDEIHGTIKFIFQPAEEMLSLEGAYKMIQEGVLDNPKVDSIVALHVWPTFKTGTAAIKHGPIMVASDKLTVSIKGKSGHGSAPQEGTDAIVIAANVVNALQTIVSRNIDPSELAVLSIGKINGGSAYNIIAEKVYMEGTIRYQNPEIEKIMLNRMENIVAGIARSMGGDFLFEKIKGVPVTVNNQIITDIVIDVIKTVIGENIIFIDKPFMAGEDFSFFSQRTPSAYFFLGCKSTELPSNEYLSLHSPTFNPDEKCIPIGMEILANIAIKSLLN